MKNSIFYHAGCSVCVAAEHELTELIGSDQVEIVHLGENRSQIDEAGKRGVKSVPALVTPSGAVLHINYGASLSDL